MPGKRACAIALMGIVMLIAAACASMAPARSSRAEMELWARERGFMTGTLKAERFDLQAFLRRPAQVAETLTVYIEGDGAAWPTPYQPPRDPTPTKLQVLAMAAADPASAVAYLGRPCQYLDTAALARCDEAYWTERRFAPEVLEAYNVALTQLMDRYGARRVRLVGYSGGGVIATLLASRRADVAGLVTVAAPLAVATWLKWHGATPLTGSLDPDAAGEKMPTVGAVHFVGGKDETVPAAVVAAYAQRSGGRLEVVAGFDHECCWTRDWATLLQRSSRAEEGK